jgi:hypothetical protein
MMIAQKAARMPPDPGPVTESRLDLVTLPSSPFWARRHVETTLKLWHADHLIETANVLASELVTNAVVFSAGSPGAWFNGGPADKPDVAAHRG